MINNKKTKIHWISTKDRLPKDGQKALIWYNCEIHTATFCQGEHRPNGPWRTFDTGCGNNKYPWGWSGHRDWQSQKITHWAEFPCEPTDEENIDDAGHDTEWEIRIKEFFK
jgi:hypothetical protein